MNLIVAVDNEWNIGYKGNLLTHIPEDMKYFREKTINKVVVMGRKTFESLPGKKPLEQRINIVLTRDENYYAEGIIICHSIYQLMKQLEAYNEEDIFVIGGGVIYKELLPYCKEAYITKIDDVFEADTKFPNLDTMENWELIKDEEWHTSKKGAIYKCIVYKNKLNVKYGNR